MNTLIFPDLHEPPETLLDAIEAIRALAFDLVWEDSQWPSGTSRDQMYGAAKAELAQLRSANERNQPT